jgi:hypothetical protein
MKKWTSYDGSRAKLLALAGISVLLTSACGGSDHDSDQTQAAVPDARLLAQGQAVFRFDTFGDETQWTDTLRMHEVIGSAVDPTTALAVGLKVDAEALPTAVVQGIRDGSVDLKSPATTVALLKLNAVVGLQGKVDVVNGKDTLTRVGVTCALCHSTVDNSFAPGIGKRLDGWANRDLNPGAIIALSPALSATMKAVYNSSGKASTIRASTWMARMARKSSLPRMVLKASIPLPPPAMATMSPTGTATSASPKWVDMERSSSRARASTSPTNRRSDYRQAPCLAGISAQLAAAPAPAREL